MPDKKKGKTMSGDIINQVAAFFEDDEYSHIMPGKKDFLSISRDTHKQNTFSYAIERSSIQLVRVYTHTQELVSQSSALFVQNGVLQLVQMAHTLFVYVLFIKMLFCYWRHLELIKHIKS